MHRFRRKGVYVLPSLITTMNFFCGFYALIAVFNGYHYKAAVAIMIAGVFDFLDGKVARITNSTSRFGMEYDSLSDLISFGIAPGFLVYSWVLQPYGRIGWMAAFLYVICGALRLARFNAVQDEEHADDKFVGLPIPAGAIVIASLVILAKDFLLVEKLHPLILVATVYTLAFLMVSNIRYESFKQFDFKIRKPFEMLVIMVLFIYVVAVIPELMIFLMAIGYLLSGPASWLFSGKLAKKGGAVKQRELHTEK